MSFDLETEIARRLDVSRESVAHVLEVVVERIRQQVSHYGYARVAGLGTFRGENGGIIFEPTSTLVEEVNLNFSGLEPIYIPSVFGPENAKSHWPPSVGIDEPAPGDESFSSEDKSVAEEMDDSRRAEGDEWTDAAAEEDVAEASETPVGEQDDEDAEDVPKVQWRPIDLQPKPRDLDETAAMTATGGADSRGGVHDDTEEAAADAPAEGVDEVAEASAVDEAETVPASHDIDAEEHEQELPAEDMAQDRSALPHESLRQHHTSRHASERVSAADTQPGGRRTIWIGAGVIVLAAAAAIMFFSLTPDGPTDPAPTEQTEAPALADNGDAEVADDAVGAVDATEPGETATGEAPIEESPDEESPPAEDQPADGSTSLRSTDGINVSEGGYTIIVYSESSRQRAAEVSEQYREEGFRTDVLEYQEDGANHLRVGVGQFSTLTEAAETRNSLVGTDLPDDAWVRRVPAE